MSNQNPYASAAEAYGSTAAVADQRALEAKALLKAAQKIDDIAQRMRNGEAVSYVDVGAALEHNQKLWLLFVNDAMSGEHPLPLELRNNIASLGMFVFKRSKELLIDSRPEQMKVLVDINRNIASGLMKRAAAPAMPSGPLSSGAPAAAPASGNIAASSGAKGSTDIMS